MSTATETGSLTNAQEQIVEDLEFEPPCCEKFISPTRVVVDCPDPATWFVVYVRACEPRTPRNGLMCDTHHRAAVDDTAWLCGRCDSTHPLRVIRTESLR